MQIEQTLPESVLNILSNYYLNNKEQYGTHYSIQYTYFRTTGVFIEFFNQYEEQEQTGDETLIAPVNGTRCKLIVKNSDTGEFYTAENFDYSTIKCNSAAVSFYKTYQTKDELTTNTASDFYSNNYLDYNKYTTLEIEPSPSPSPEPETPTTNGFDNINPYFWILPSFLLMLMFMYKFLDKIFSTGK